MDNRQIETSVKISKNRKKIVKKDNSLRSVLKQVNTYTNFLTSYEYIG